MSHEGCGSLLRSREVLRHATRAVTRRYYLKPELVRELKMLAEAMEICVARVRILHENLLVHDEESPQQKAIRLLNRQLGELQTVRALNYLDPKFKAWRNTTMGVLERFLGKDSHHTRAFFYMDFCSMEMTVTPFGGSVPPDYISAKDTYEFKRDCEATDELLRAAIREIEDFGVHTEDVRPASVTRGRGGGVSQNFHGPVSIQNLAIAADSANQKIGHMGGETGASLKEIAELLRQSEDLTPREMKNGLAAIGDLAVEMQKPEPKRNWKAVLDSGERVLEIAGKAIDLGEKLAPYIPAIATIVANARHLL